jgi:hypothetical protein
MFWCNFLTLSSTSYLSCIVDTSCKQTLQLALSEVGTSRTTRQNNTQYFVFTAFSTLQQLQVPVPYR